MALEDVRGGVRDALRWVNRRPSLVAMLEIARDVIPGDSNFGDPMSTSGTSPTQALGRRARTIQEGRFSLLGEVILAALQLADWLGEDVRGIASGEEQSILFLDLRGFSQWALTAGEGEVASLLRNVDVIVTEAVETRDGLVVKRLGDGAMAIFADCQQAVEAAFDAIAHVAEARVDRYRPLLRGGLHVGRPHRIGQDYVGVEVNIAARLCEAAPGSGVLVSGEVADRLEGRWPVAPARDIRLRGVPAGVSIHFAHPPASDRSRARWPIGVQA